MTAPAFVCVASLHNRMSASGKPILYGEWNKVRLYVWTADKPPACDTDPAYHVFVRIDDYLKHSQHMPPKLAAERGDGV